VENTRSRMKNRAWTRGQAICKDSVMYVYLGKMHKAEIQGKGQAGHEGEEQQKVLK